ncbi:MAG: hypothetical protein HBSAPP04_17200 [Ignavibacteriaceae bacterium]|nr:MAG: hypothetical protein HBSAPP04_17200 [Ignavibacteriaceae bacterium]
MSKTNLFTFLFYAVIIIAAFFLVSCSSAVEVMSDRQEIPILINGDRSDWTGNLTQSDDRKTAFGFRNDSQFLYLLVTTPDRATAMKMLMQGLTVTINSGKGEKLDIKYPMKPLPEDLRDIRGMEKRDEQPDLDGFITALKKVNDQIQVVTKDDYPIYTAPAAGGKYLKGSFGMSSGNFVVELQIPLSGDEISGRLFPVFPEELLLNFKTGSIAFDGPRAEGGGKGQGGGGGMGRGGGRGGHGGGDRPGGGGARPDFKPVDLSFKVKMMK